jgi:ABC-type sugar transport system ATPase subunit
MADASAPSRAVTARLRGVHKSYGPVRVLDLPEFDLYAGEVVGVVGENGAGKSTLMGALAGSVHPDGGDIEIHGVHLAPGSTEAAARLGIALVSQEFPLVGQLSVAENLLLGRRPRQARAGALIDRAAMRAEAEEMLHDIGLHLDFHRRRERAGCAPPDPDPVAIEIASLGPITCC